MGKARVCFIVLGGFLLLAVLAGCTYHAHYYGVGPVADEKVIVKERYRSE